VSHCLRLSSTRPGLRRHAQPLCVAHGMHGSSGSVVDVLARDDYSSEVLENFLHGLDIRPTRVGDVVCSRNDWSTTRDSAAPCREQWASSNFVDQQGSPSRSQGYRVEPREPHSGPLWFISKGGCAAQMHTVTLSGCAMRLRVGF